MLLINNSYYKTYYVGLNRVRVYAPVRAYVRVREGSAPISGSGRPEKVASNRQPDLVRSLDGQALECRPEVVEGVDHLFVWILRPIDLALPVVACRLLHASQRN